MIPTPRLMELVRFGAVAVVGLAVDLSTAWVLSTQLRFPLTVAAMAGFCVGAAVNYVLHELWTFRGGAGQISTRRGLIYFGTLGLVLAARIGCLSLLEQVAGGRPGKEMPLLLGATAFSFVVNYLLARHVVFRSSGETGGVNPRTETE